MPSTINAQPGNATAFTALIKTSDGTANLALQTNGVNAITIDNTQNANFVSTGATKIPSGTTAQRPSPAVNGMIRYNTDFSGVLEGYINGVWTAISGLYTYTATYLVVAGGGSGATSYGGLGGAGGGAGGLLTGTTTLAASFPYTIIVGAGGVGLTGVSPHGLSGSNSQFGVLTAAVGGGYGSNYGSTSTNGGAGGSGGGGSWSGGTGGAATGGQGNAGGAGATGSPDSGWGGGGGGGAGATGGNGSGTTAGNGGIGTSSSITGSAVYYAGGGGGAGVTNGTGGSGGGGNGNWNTGAGFPGAVNTGGGGGAGGNSWGGSNGGSGVVILSVPTTSFSNNYSGANVVVTTSGANTIMKFNSSGMYVA